MSFKAFADWPSSTKYSAKSLISAKVRQAVSQLDR